MSRERSHLRRDWKDSLDTGQLSFQNCAGVESGMVNFEVWRKGSVSTFWGIVVHHILGGGKTCMEFDTSMIIRSFF